MAREILLWFRSVFGRLGGCRLLRCKSDRWPFAINDYYRPELKRIIPLRICADLFVSCVVGVLLKSAFCKKLPVHSPQFGYNLFVLSMSMPSPKRINVDNVRMQAQAHSSPLVTSRPRPYLFNTFKLSSVRIPAPSPSPNALSNWKGTKHPEKHLFLALKCRCMVVSSCRRANQVLELISCNHWRANSLSFAIFVHTMGRAYAFQSKPSHTPFPRWMIMGFVKVK